MARSRLVNRQQAATSALEFPMGLRALTRVGVPIEDSQPNFAPVAEGFASNPVVGGTFDGDERAS